MVFSLMRRRQSKSPSSESSSKRNFFASNNKRRSLFNETSWTEQESVSSQSSQTSSAAWRVENIRPHAPKESEWWPEETAIESSFESCDADSLNSGGVSERIETIIVKANPSDTQTFHNCGLETWLHARKEWKRRTVEVLPPRPRPPDYNQLVRGLKRHSIVREYQLPRRMVLSDLIDVYTDIWAGEV